MISIHEKEIRGNRMEQDEQNSREENQKDKNVSEGIKGILKASLHISVWELLDSSFSHLIILFRLLIYKGLISTYIGCLQQRLYVYMPVPAFLSLSHPHYIDIYIYIYNRALLLLSSDF